VFLLIGLRSVAFGVRRSDFPPSKARSALPHFKSCLQFLPPLRKILLQLCHGIDALSPTKMDPLTILASVVGLQGAARSVEDDFLAVKQSISEAPQFMDSLLAQVKDFRACLSTIHSFLLGITHPISRIFLIRANQLVVTLAESAETISELEALATSIARDKGGLPLVSRLKSVWKVEKVVGIMLLLERHKSSLSLMLAIAQK
jgi:hypothetical protein